MKVPIPSQAASEDGFTMVELLVMLTIVAGMSGFAWTKFNRSSPAADVRKTGDAVAIYLERVRNMTLLLRRSHLVTFDTRQRVISSDGLPDTVSWPETISVSADVSEREAATSSFGIRFNPDGSTTGGTVRFGEGRAIYEVSVSWLTGQVRRDREF